MLNLLQLVCKDKQDGPYPLGECKQDYIVCSHNTSQIEVKIRTNIWLFLVIYFKYRFDFRCAHRDKFTLIIAGYVSTNRPSMNAFVSLF